MPWPFVAPHNRLVELARLIGLFTMGLGTLQAQQPLEPTVGAHAPLADYTSVHLRPVVPAGRRSIGISLEGGGALGLAHVGVLLWMEQHHVPIDRITGTSMGALVGSLVASGHSAEDIQQLGESNVFTTLFTTRPSLNHMDVRRREDRQEMLGAFTIGLKGGGVTGGNELLSDDRLNAFLSSELTGYNAALLNFDDLPVPFRCVATDLTTLKPDAFRSGSLVFAVRASISIPGVFAPVRSGNSILIDGAITDNLPIDLLRDQLHPDVSISVYLGDSSFSEADASSLAGVLGRALSAGASRNVALTRPLADIEIAPSLGTLSVTDYAKAAALIKAGFDAAEKQRDRLLPLALDEQDWKLYRADLDSRKRSTPKRVVQVRVEGPNPAISERLKRQVDQLGDKAFSSQAASDVVSDIRGEGAFDAYYDTFQTVRPAPLVAGAATPPDDGIIIHWRPRFDGPPFLLINTDVMAMNANVTSAELHLRFVDENLGGYGSELRSDAQVGYLTRLSTEYYRPIARTRFYAQPHLEFLRQPIYFWEAQKRISERLLQRAGGGIDIGYTFGRKLHTAVEYRNNDFRWVLKEGTDGSPTPHLSGTSQSVAGHVVFSNRSAEIAAPSGSQVDLTVGHLLHTAQSEEAPFAILKSRQSFTFGQVNSLVLSVNASTYFRKDVADPLRFTLGGPLRLSGSSVDEFRGTDTALVQSFYLRRLANLPTGLGQGLYLATGYEAGSIWSPERHSILRQDGIAGLLVNTPLGALTVGGAIGDAGRRKVFFTLGRFF